MHQKALYGQSQDRLSILCEDEVAEGVIRGVPEVLNIEMGLPHEDIVVGRNTGRNEVKNNEIPEFLHALKDQIIRWRRF